MSGSSSFSLATRYRSLEARKYRSFCSWKCYCLFFFPRWQLILRGVKEDLSRATVERFGFMKGTNIMLLSSACVARQSCEVFFLWEWVFFFGVCSGFDRFFFWEEDSQICELIFFNLKITTWDGELRRIMIIGMMACV